MGISLGKLVTGGPCKAQDLKGKRVAIDVPNLAYAFYTAQLSQVAQVTPEVRRAAVRVAMRGLFTRVLDLSDRGARSVLVLDGPPHPLKREALEEREAQRKLPRLEQEDLAAVERIAAVLGLPVVQAPHDAEAQAAWMARSGRVDVVATTDWDPLAMGAPALLRGLSARHDGPRPWSLVYAPHALLELDLARSEQLAAAAVLMGCDYSAGLPGIGPKRALALVRKHAHLEEVLDGMPALERDAGGEILALPRWREALGLFLDPPHVPEAPRWRAPLLPALGGLLEELGVRDDQELAARLARLDLLHVPPRALQDEDLDERARRQAARADEERRGRAVASTLTPGQANLSRWGS